MSNSMSFSRTDPNHEEQIISDENSDEFEHTLIDDIDNNGYLIQEEVTDLTHIYNTSLRYTILGRTFATSDDAYDFYNKYGLSKGFGIRKHQLNRCNDTNKVYRRIFSCNKEGFKDMNDKIQLRDNVKRRCITRTGCKALMQVTLSSEGEWVVDKFSDEHNHTSDIFVTWSCARFETSGILCKHILYIMRRESLTTIPDHYIIPRWTMKATYKVGGIETRRLDKNDMATKEVTLLTIWSIRAKFNKILQDGRDSFDEINKIDVVLNGLLEEQSRRKKTIFELNNNIDDDIPSTQQENMSQQRL